MKKKLYLFLILVCICQIVCAREANLYHKFKDYPEIKVYLDKVGDESDNPKVVRETFRKVFKEVIEKRIEIIEPEIAPIQNTQKIMLKNQCQIMRHFEIGDKEECI